VAAHLSFSAAASVLDASSNLSVAPEAKIETSEDRPLGEVPLPQLEDETADAPIFC
jgi:hypothetical protein